MTFQKRNIVEYTENLHDQPEDSIYHYRYNKKTKKLTHYYKGKTLFSKEIDRYDKNIIVFKKGGTYLRAPYKKNVLDDYKKESNIDISGYYQYDDNTELYLSKDKKIYFGSMDGIKKGEYEVLEFNPSDISYPVINYTLEGQTKEGNTNSVHDYNDTSLYITDTITKNLSRCSKHRKISLIDECEYKDPKRIKDITQLKYLNNIE